MSSWTLHNGDSREVLRGMADGSIEACVCDPPYELGFMGRAWDASGIAYDVTLWREVLRALKPGGYLLAFGGTRTYHRMTCAIEDAGFEIRDSLHWIYGSGFPKSLDVSKAIDKAAGAMGHEGRSMRVDGNVGTASYRPTIDSRDYVKPEPKTPPAREWSGWGTALKPAHEPIVVARKPLDGTVAANVQTHGTGAINVDACRVQYASASDRAAAAQRLCQDRNDGPGMAWGFKQGEAALQPYLDKQSLGRWPANVLLSHSDDCGETCAADCPCATMDRQSGGTDNGASRFFTRFDAEPPFAYIAKPSTAERERGLEHRARVKVNDGRAATADNPRLRGETQRGNTHPTVKPIAIMRWLVRLVCRPGALVLDPFAGSGTTGIAALAEGCRFVGVELDETHAEIARARIQAWAPGAKQDDGAKQADDDAEDARQLGLFA